MKKLLYIAFLGWPLFSHALLTNTDLIGRYKVFHSMIEMTLEITPENKVTLFEKPSTPDEDALDCKSDSYKIKNNIFETTLVCAYKGTKKFSADLTGINVENLGQGVQVPIEAFGHSLVVTVKRQ